MLPTGAVSRHPIGRFVLEGGGHADLAVERVVEPFWSPHRRDAIRLVIDAPHSGAGMPCVRGDYSPSSGVLKIEEIRRGFVAPGQRFTEGALAGLRQLIPEITTLRVANVTHAETQRLLRDHLGTERRMQIPIWALRGPLLLSLAAIGCSAIYAEVEGAYFHATGVLEAQQGSPAVGQGSR